MRRGTSRRCRARKGAERGGDLVRPLPTARNGRRRAGGRWSDPRPARRARRAGSGSKAVSFIPQMTRVGTCTLGKARSSQSGSGTVSPGGGTTTLRRAIPVEHRRRARRAATSRRYIAAARLSGIVARSTWPREGLVEEPVDSPSPRPTFSKPGRAERGDILRSRALVRVLDQALLEDHRMRRVDDGQPRQPRIAAQRRGPGDRAAPVVADQREPSRAQAHRRARICRRPACRSCKPSTSCGRSDAGKAALIGHDQTEAVLKQRRDPAPGAVRFGKAVEQDHRRASPDRRPSATLSVTPVESATRAELSVTG